jgi:hypothetical protein|tara:strand:- start:499 stop:1059 length:561 start_codon:yes stop_codon:yes gene_type:complete
MKQTVISAAIFLGCALMSTGCSALTTSETETKAEQSISESPVQPSDPPESADPPEPSDSSESADPLVDVEKCSARSYSEAKEVIKGQIKEFGLGRFKEAREYASVQFREAVSLKNFRNIINEDYSFLLESPKISFNTCIERYKVIYIQVALTAQKVTVLDYRLIRDQEGLGIDAALITAKSVEVEA